MEIYLRLALYNFWSFCGVVILTSLFLSFIFKMYNRTFRHWNIRKHGYPPPHCDADGDFSQENKEK
jgi:hypothetical protein